MVNALTCPAYTHKTAIKGQISSLPAGWFVYAEEWGNGLYKSSIQSYSPSVIPSTESDQPRSIDISDDGKWIVYATGVGEYGARCYIVSTAGKFKTEIPTNHANTVRFLRNSPYGTEIFYTHSRSKFHAVKVTLQDNAAPQIGQDRTVADFSSDWNYEITIWGGSDGQYGVYGDQIVGKMGEPVNGAQVNRTAFITIPDQGRGIAGPEDIYKWANDHPNSLESDGSYWGCGFTMSHDGQMCLQNSAWIGNECLPSKYSTVQIDGQTYLMDHKGPYITKFLRSGSLPIEINAQILDPAYGVSINWCPTEYWIGNYMDLEFNEWSFSNSNQFVIGALKGRIAPRKAIWILQWSTNTWTMITPDQNNTVYTDPAVYFTGVIKTVTPVPQILQGRPVQMKIMTVGRGAKRIASGSFTECELFTIRGISLGNFKKQPGSDDIELPTATHSALLVKWKR